MHTGLNYGPDVADFGFTDVKVGDGVLDVHGGLWVDQDGLVDHASETLFHLHGLEGSQDLVVVHADVAILHQSLGGSVSWPVLPVVLEDKNQNLESVVAGDKLDDGAEVLDVAGEVEDHADEKVS